MTLGSFPQRKHYETIPKSLSELDFFVSFFSHLTAIVNAHCPGAFDLLEPNEGAWKGGDAKDVEATDTFTEAWGGMTKAKRGAVGALCGKLCFPLSAAPRLAASAGARRARGVVRARGRLRRKK